MNAPTYPRNFEPARTPNRQPVDTKHRGYEANKAQLTASARTPAEYEAACRRAAKIAGV